MTQIPRYRGVNGVRARLAGIAPGDPMPATRGLIRQTRCTTATLDDQPASASYRARSGWLTVLSVARSYRSGSVIPRTEGTVLIRMADVGGATRPEMPAAAAPGETDEQLGARVESDAIPLLDQLFSGAERLRRNRADAEELVGKRCCPPPLASAHFGPAPISRRVSHRAHAGGRKRGTCSRSFNTS
jgi:hypothetical protein